MELKLPAPSLLVLIGPSGSGKSTWAREHFSSAEVVSSDSLRGMVGAGEDDQTASTAAFQLLEQIVDERLKRGLTVVIDTMGYDDEARARWVEKAHDAGMPAHAILFDTPAEVCERHNEIRDKPVPKSVLKSQVSRFAAVSQKVSGESFDGVHTQQPVAMVAPTVAAATTTPRLESRRAGHSFGLMVSRMDWPVGDRGEQLTAVATRAETAGFRDIWVMDHFRQIRGVGRPWEDIPEAYIALGFMAGATTTIRLGALVTGITHRPPIVVGKMLATLDVLSGGRAVCGLGTAWDEAEHGIYGIEFPSLATRYDLLEETLRMLPLLWGKGTPQFNGVHIRSPELICYPRPIQDPIPILVGGGGEKRTLRLVAQYADACNVFGDPGRVEHKARVLAAHCEEVERDPAEIELSHLTNALAATDRKELRNRVDRMRNRNTTSESFMKRHNAGTAEDLVELFTAYSAAGAHHSIVTIPDVWEEGSIETFGEVIAEFAG